MEWENYLRFVLALLFVLGLIGVLTAVVRKYGLGAGNLPIRKGKERRLKLVEVLPLDAKRRAVLLSRDNIEHLVILGPESEIVVETQIAPMAQEQTNPQEFSEVLETTAAEKNG